jgi:hypothetical protein
MRLAQCSPSVRRACSSRCGWLRSCSPCSLWLRSVFRAIYAMSAIEPSTLSLTPMCVAEEDEAPAPLLALTGILRPRLVVSRRLLDILSAQQLEIAISHEQAHERSRDNLKRLILAVAPGAFPFFRGFRAIERQWERHAELAADEAATAGQVNRALTLAEALVQVARLRSYEQILPLASTLSSHDLELALRIDRLLAAGPTVPSPQTFPPSPRLARHGVVSRVRGSFRNSATLWSAALLLATIAMLPLLGTLHPLYHLLESLLH